MTRGPFSRLLIADCKFRSVAISNCEIVSVAISGFSVNLDGTRTVLAHLTTGRFVSNYENENGSRHRRERRAYLAHAHAVLARRFKPASQAIKPASQRPPLCTETAELRNQFQNLVIRGPFSRLLFANCEIVSVAISNCEIVSVAISEFSVNLG